MKKYLLGLSAVVLAIGFSAFSTVKEKSFANITLTFDYIGHDVFDQADVETEGFWKENVTPPTCNGSNAACTIIVDQSNTTGTPGSRVLDASKVTLTASGSAVLGYKPNTQAALLTITNKP